MMKPSCTFNVDEGAIVLEVANCRGLAIFHLKNRKPLLQAFRYLKLLSMRKVTHPGALRVWCQKEHLKEGVAVEFVESIRNFSDERAISLRVSGIVLSSSSLKAKTNRVNTLS